MKFIPFLMSAFVLLAACGSKPEASEEVTAPDTTQTASVEVASADTAPASFAQCSVCHSVTKDGANGAGPNLHAIIGKKSAHIAGFNYSAALKEANLVWDEATLDKYIESPRGLVAGTRMSYAGQKDPAKRKQIIDWLKKNS